MNGVNLMNNTLKLMHWTAKHPVYTHTHTVQGLSARRHITSEKKTASAAPCKQMFWTQYEILRLGNESISSPKPIFISAW